MSRPLPQRTGRVSPLPINWRRSLGESYEFKTDMFAARNGVEDRWALRQDPRYVLEHDCWVYQDEIGRYLADLAEGQDQPFVVPKPWRRVYTAATSAGTTLNVTEVPWWLVAGCRLVIAGPGTVEAVRVVSISGTALTLEANLSAAYPANLAVMLAFLGRAQDDISFRPETDRLWRGKVMWEAAPGADPWPAMPETRTLYEGHEVFLREPNWRDRPRVSIVQAREMLDSGRGVIAVSGYTGESQLELRLLYSGFDQATAESLLAFYMRMKGKRGAFWMPTWQRDLTIVSGSGTSLTLAGNGPFFAYNGSRVFRAVAARHADGSYQVNRIVSMAVVSGNTVATMAQAWTAPLTAASTVMWSPLWRFATDRLEVERVTAAVSEMQFSVLSLIEPGVV